METAIIALISSVVGALIAQVGAYIRDRKNHSEVVEDKKVDKEKYLEDGMCALLRDRLLQLCVIHETNGFCPDGARVNLDKMYKAYHNLGGNDVVTDEVNKVKKLPLEKIGDE